MEIRLDEKQVPGTGQLFGSEEAANTDHSPCIELSDSQGLEGMESQFLVTTGKREGEVLNSMDSCSMEDVILKIQTCLFPKNPQCKINTKIHTAIFLVAENTQLFKIKFLTLKLGK